MECTKRIYHILLEKLRRRKRIALATECAPDGSVVKRLAEPGEAPGECACRENRMVWMREEGGALRLYEPYTRPARLILLGDGAATRELTALAAARGFAVTVADEAPGIAAHLPGARQTLCDALPAAARCLHITDDDAVVLAPARFEEALACVEQLWEEPQTAFLGLIDPSAEQNWRERLAQESAADETWLARMTVVRATDAAAARNLLEGICAAWGETQREDEAMAVIELLARLPARLLEQKRAVLTVLEADGAALVGRKMIAFENGETAGSLGGLEKAAAEQMRAVLETGGWRLCQPRPGTAILIEAD